MVAKGFHALLIAFDHIRVVVIASLALHSQTLEFIHSCVLPVPALQHARKWCIWFVRGRYSTHDVAVAVLNILPSMRIARSAQCVGMTAMRTRVRAKFGWELFFQLRPSRWEIRILVSMRRVSHVLILSNVNGFWITFAI